MTKTVVRNLISVLELLFSFCVLAFGLFLIFYYLPFSPLAHLVSKLTHSASSASLPPEAQAILETQWGLHEPFLNRLFTFFKDLFRGDFGQSVWTGQSIGSLIWQRGGPSLFLAALSLLGVSLSSLSWAGSEVLSKDFLFGKVLFWKATILLCIPPFATGVFFQHIFPEVRSVILALGLYVLTPLPYLVFLLNAKLKEELTKSHVRSALAQGSPWHRIIARNLFKPMLGVLLSFLPAWWSIYWATSLVVEPLFRISGVGLLTFEAYRNQDGPLLLGISLLLGFGRLFLGWLRDQLFNNLFNRQLSNPAP